MALSPQPQFDSFDAASVHAGMAVYGRDGERLGFVREVWADLPEHGFVQKSRIALNDYGPIRGTQHLFEDADGYLQVSPTRVLRREGDVDLFIPLDAVDDVVPARSIILDTATRHCSKFGDRPACLDR